MGTIKLKEEAVKPLEEEIELLKAAAKDGFQWSDIDFYIGRMAIALKNAETFFGKSGKDKRAYLVRTLDDIIILPWWAEMIDGPLISLAVTGIVALFDKHGWDINSIGRN